MTRATAADIHELAASMPGVELASGKAMVYQVRGKSFVFFRSPRPDAVDPDTGARLADHYLEGTGWQTRCGEQRHIPGLLVTAAGDSA